MKYLSLFKFGRGNIRYFSNDVRHKLEKSYFYMTGSTPLSSATIGNVIDEAANKAGDETAFISEHQGISKTYEEFRKDVDKLASGLIAHGLQKGDRIALYCPNCYEWPLIQFAAAKASLVLVNINPVSQPNELEYCLGKVGCKTVISFDKFKKQDGYEIFNKIIPNLFESNPKCLQSKNLPILKSIIMLSEQNKKGIVTFQEVFCSGNKDSRNILSQLEKTIQIDDPVNIQFTSGTTGTPKAAVLSHHGIINNALLSSTRQGFHKMKHILCYQVPMFHIMGCVLSTLAMVLFQGTCVLPSSAYNPKAILKCIEKYKCTTTIGTPTMYIDLLKIYEELHNNINSLRHVIVGGASPSENLLIDLNKKLNSPCLQIIYGLTEVNGCVLISKEDSDYETKIKGYMPPIEHIEVKVVDEKGAIVPPNNPGELCCRGFNLFLGYSDDEQTAKVVDKAHWFHTGDIAVMNEKGELRLAGRIKDMVIRGGENIYCLEVENFISSHPAILDVHIVGVPDERMGEELCCWIAVRPGMSLTEEEIKNFCKGKISYFKIPRYIIFVDEFPKTFSGKVKKYEMAKISKKKILQ